MNKKSVLKTKAILQELDSDDELPDVYTDTIITPAYLFDNRFDEIKFDWIHNSNPSNSDIHLKKISDQYDSKILHKKVYMKGVLKHQDLYCLKAVELFTCSSTLIWFVHFLLHKDLQSHYKYLKSCLVKDHVSPSLLIKNEYKENLPSVSSNRFEVVIKS